MNGTVNRLPVFEELYFEKFKITDDVKLTLLMEVLLQSVGVQSLYSDRPILANGPCRTRRPNSRSNLADNFMWKDYLLPLNCDSLQEKRKMRYQEPM